MVSRYGQSFVKKLHICWVTHLVRQKQSLSCRRLKTLPFGIGNTWCESKPVPDSPNGLRSGTCSPEIDLYIYLQCYSIMKYVICVYIYCRVLVESWLPIFIPYYPHGGESLPIVLHARWPDLCSGQATNVPEQSWFLELWQQAKSWIFYLFRGDGLVVHMCLRSLGGFGTLSI